MAGVSDEARQREIDERTTAYEQELATLESGATATILRDYWEQETGGQRGRSQRDPGGGPLAERLPWIKEWQGKVPGKSQGTMEDFYTQRFGGPAEGTGPAESAAPAQGGRRPGGPGAAAPVAGLGQTRPWWSI